MTASGSLRLSVSCTAPDCAGQVALTSEAAGAAMRRGRSAAFRVRDRGTAAVALQLTPRERRTFARRGRLVLRLTTRLAGAEGATAHRVVVRRSGRSSR